MTLLIASVMDEKVSGLIAKADAAMGQGADAVELRLDRLDGASDSLFTYVQRTAAKTRFLVTCRSKAEGGFSESTATQRAEWLARAACSANVSVDFEFHDWQASKQARSAIIKSGAAEGADHAKRIILSYHDFDSKPAELSQVVEAMLATGSVAKVAYFAHGVLDTFDALDLMHKHNGCVIALAMGEFGLWTRVLSKKLKAFGSYCSLADTEVTAPGQVSLGDMTSQYRWTGHDESTSVYGVVGDPISHSMSPVLFNHWFEQYAVNAVYVPIRVDRKLDSMEAFLTACVQRPWLDLRGLSVTVPHKPEALKWAGQGADRLARCIGAANTLHFAGDGVRAYNTDCNAAIDSMAAALHCDRSDLAMTSVDILGAGGAARAMLAGLRELGCDVNVYGRTAERTKRLASEFGATAVAWNKRVGRSGAILINCTTVGLWPAVGATPIPQDALFGCELVFDLIYNPLETSLLADARVAGARSLNGVDMFVRQAAAQLALWTGIEVDRESAKTWIEQEISLQKETQH